MLSCSILICMAGKSNEPLVFSEREREFLEGALLGDGHVTKPRGQSCQFSYTTSKRSHAEYVHEQLKRMVVNECKDGPVESHTYDERTEKTYTSYRVRAICNLSFYHLRNRWYPEGKKVVPSDVELTPLTMLLWYIGDGALLTPNRSQYIKLCTNGFPKDNIEQVLLPKMQQYEASLVKSTPSQWWIYIPRRKIETFLSFIGDCPVSDYTYKWEVRPYKYKGVELNGMSDYADVYPKIIDAWKSGGVTIYELSKKFKVPIRCIKDEFDRNMVPWKPVENKKSILQTDLFDIPIKIWYSGQQIKKALGFNAGAISECCRGLRKQHKGFKWQFVKKETPLVAG